MPISRLPGLSLSSTTMSILEAADAAGQLTLFNSVEELVAAAAHLRSVARMVSIPLGMTCLTVALFQK